MKKKNLRYLNYLSLFTFILFYVFFGFSGMAQDKKENKPAADHTGIQTHNTTSQVNYYRDLFSDTWVATDAIGRKMPAFDQVGSVKTDKTRVVSMFYITWHTQDHFTNFKSPYAADVSKILKADPGARLDANHSLWSESSYHWGEPEMGYFLSQDEYVIRKDMSMLADAGVDVLIMDVTNAVRYWDEWEVLFKTMQKMKEEGNKVPQFCFWAFNGPVIAVVQDLYDRIYKTNRFQDLWYYWDGKPLLLYNGTPRYDANGQDVKQPNPHYDPSAKTDVTNPHYSNPDYAEEFYKDYTQEVKNFFTKRTMWWGYNEWAGKRFVGTEDNWSFGYDLGNEKVKAMNPNDLVSTHNGIKEEAAVTPGQHPSSLVGKSWRRETGQPPLNEYDMVDSAYVPWLGKTVKRPEGYGIYFQDRWDEALKTDPEMLYVNDWNEWTAGKYPPLDGVSFPFMGRKSKYFFVDQYNAEFNRCVQPMKDGYTDNYYMQLAQNIRKYKGIRPIPEQKGFQAVEIDGQFADWKRVTNEFRDTKGDIFHRDHNGYGGLHYTNESGRNDIITSKVAVDKQNINFYVETADKLTTCNGNNWMLLLIDADNNPETGWFGYDFIINKSVKNDNTTTLMRYDGAHPENPWVEIADLKFRYVDNKMEVAVPRKLLELNRSSFTFDFKWSDNATDLKDPISLCINGDTAPNRRFNYRFIWNQYATLLVNAQDNKNRTIDYLRCCNMINPEGVNSPLLSWKIMSTEEGISQKAWEIEIATTNELLIKGKADAWKSGKNLSSEQFNIAPNGAKFIDATGYYWHVRIWDNVGKVSIWSKPAYFSIGLSGDQSWKAKWITYNEAKDSAIPYFRKVFNLSKENATPIKAMVYLCGLGCSELYMNGQIVDSTRFLDPAQTNYEQYALYSTFDVTRFLHKNDNCIGVILGKGWFTQDTGWGGGGGFSYGNPILRIQIVVLYSDGTRNELGSDESWMWKYGPVIKTNLYLGELYDARKEVKKWCETGTPSTDWKKAILAKDNVPPRLIPQLMEPIRTKQVLKAVKMWQDSIGNWIFDFGVNVAGIPRLVVKEPAGIHLTIRISEEKKTNGCLDFTSLGWINHGKIPTDEYICKGEGIEQWSPRFTYHGFRYAELSGMQHKPDLSTMSLIVVHSDLTKSGAFECANTQINRLHELAMGTVLSNLHGIPTDCPDREKCGWLGDSHAYVKMANLNLQMNNFWMKYLEDIRTGANGIEKNTLFHERSNNKFYFTKKPAGLPYMIAPGKRLCGVASPDWGTAIVQLPWWLYVYYGNKKALSDYYPSMKQWTDYVSGLAQDTARTNKYSHNTKHIVYQGLGDWCPPESNATIDAPIEFTSTAFHYLDVSIMEQTAHILAKNTDAQMYALEKELIAKEVVANLYNAQKKTFGSQTADAMALDFGLVPKGDEKAVSDAIVRNMNGKYKGFMHCGIFGLSRIGSMLARNGNNQTAWNMFTKKGENSFEWMWSSADATSLWEVLPINSISKKTAENGSLNHPMQAGYDICFYEDIAGIRPDSSGYGFKVVRFEPLFTDYLTWAKASIESPYGTVASSWKKEAHKLTWRITIPPNSSGLVALPDGKNITVNGGKLCFKKYVLASSSISETSLYYFPSGTFNILEW